MHNKPERNSNPIEFNLDKKAKTKQAKAIKKLNKTELMDRFADGDIDVKTFCELMDVNDQKIKGKKKIPGGDKSQLMIKPVKDFFKTQKTNKSEEKNLEVHAVSQFCEPNGEAIPYITLNELLADLD